MLLLGGLLIYWFVYNVSEGAKVRAQVEKERREQEAEYNKLLREGKELDALHKYHSKEFTRHPSFCKCIKCSIKRTFTS